MKVTGPSLVGGLVLLIQFSYGTASYVSNLPLNRVGQLVAYLTLTAALLLSGLIHELGHVILARLVGFEIHELHIRWYGLEVRMEGEVNTHQEALVTAGGLVASGLLAGLLFIVAFCDRGVTQYLTIYLMVCNVGIFVINAFPWVTFGTDGYHLTKYLLNRLFPKVWQVNVVIGTINLTTAIVVLNLLLVWFQAE